VARLGRQGQGSEPPIDLDAMLDLTSKATVNGTRFDGWTCFSRSPCEHRFDQRYLKRLADKVRARNFVVGSVVAPVWPPTAAVQRWETTMNGSDSSDKSARLVASRGSFETSVFDLTEWFALIPASSVTDWEKDPKVNTKRIGQTFKEAAKVAKDHGERLAAEGEICWGGMHSWKYMLQLLEEVGQPKVVGFQADMAHTLLYVLGYNAPEHRIVPEKFSWEPGEFHAAMKKMTNALRPWTIDFHVAQNDATVKGSGSHDKTGRHCLATDS